MPTLELLRATSIDDNGLLKDPKDALDLDGYKEFSIYVRTQNHSGSTLHLDIFHAARNQAWDFIDTVTSFTLTPNSTASMDYISSFSRFLMPKASFGTSSSDNRLDLEILVVPKR